MGREAKRKAAARANRPPRADLRDLLAESISFLQASAAAFDNGYEAEAKRLAVTLRVLLHDTDASHSLLQQLRMKEKLMWVDTADPINPHNLLPSWGLVIARMTPGEGAQYIAPIGDLSPPRIKPPAPFRTWWNDPVMKDATGQLWTRKSLVMELANKQGGAHVDPNLTERYRRLVEDNGLGAMYVDGRGEFAATGNPIAVSVRQITHEVVTTLE